MACLACRRASCTKHLVRQKISECFLCTVSTFRFRQASMQQFMNLLETRAQRLRSVTEALVRMRLLQVERMMNEPKLGPGDGRAWTRRWPLKRLCGSERVRTLSRAQAPRRALEPRWSQQHCLRPRLPDRPCLQSSGLLDLPCLLPPIAQAMWE